MKLHIKKFVLILIPFSLAATAQKKEEALGTETIEVVKPYTPTIIDGFKIKENPILEDEEALKKEPLTYTIHSMPVASTFTPIKGVAAAVEQSPKALFYDNYGSLFGGNYGTIDADLFATKKLSAADYVSASLQHLSSQGGIDGVLLPDAFYTSKAELTYSSKQKNTQWNTHLGYQNQIYHWYGLPDYVKENGGETLLHSLDTKQSYHTVWASGQLCMNNSFLKKMDINAQHFWDRMNTTENRLQVEPSMVFHLLDQTINTTFIVDYVGGSVAQLIINEQNTTNKYGFIKLGFNPNWVLNRNDWTFQVGTNLGYITDIENKSGYFYVYPNIQASFKIVDDLLVFYAGATGNVIQNTYQNAVEINPYISPSHLMQPTKQQLALYGGLRGKWSSSVVYNAKLSWLSEQNKIGFKAQDFNTTALNLKDYNYGNAFEVYYDNLKTMQLFAEIKGEFSNRLSFNCHGTFNMYQPTIQEKAWNRPNLTLNATFDFEITPKWFAGTDLFVVSKREDIQQNLGVMTLVAVDHHKTLPGYFDLNAHLDYKYNKRWTAGIRAHNIANQSYQKWLHYPVQGFQIMLGASYQFDLDL